MPEVIPALPSCTRRPRSAYHELFTKVSDGQVWKISKSEFKEYDDTSKFRNRLQTWARNRGLRAETRIDTEGSILVQVSPM